MSSFTRMIRRPRPLAPTGTGLLMLILAPAPGPAVTGQDSPDTVDWVIEPQPAGDRTALEITLTFEPEAGDPVSLGLPADCYGTPSIHEYVQSFEGLDGTAVRSGEDETRRTVRPDRDGRIRLRYRLSYDPDQMDRYAFAPNVGPDHFHIAGCQWMLRIPELDRPRPHHIRVSGAPPGWGLYSSLGPDPASLEVSGTYDDMVSAMIGGGAGPHSTFEIGGRPVSAYVQGRYDIPSRDIVEAVQAIVAGQQSAMGGGLGPFYNVAVLPRTGIIAGTAVPNLFVCFVKSDITPAELYGLLAHEMAHTWMPQSIVATPPGESEIRHEWLSEGVTEHVARRLLRRDGLITEDQFAALTNRYLYDLADNPAAAASYEDLVRAESEGGYTTAYKKLAYFRGAIMALNWETTLRERGEGKEVVDLVGELWRRAQGQPGEVTEDAFFSMATEFGLDAKGDFERYVLRGEPIAPHPNALGPEFTLTATYLPRFEPGFDIRASFRAGVVQGVQEDGPAHRAGLRDGMVFKGVRNSNRFGNAWYPDLPLKVLIETGSGEPRTIEYFPHGSPLAVMQYRRK